MDNRQLEPNERFRRVAPYAGTWLFRDREDGGRQLSIRLAWYASTQTVVLALPRGGVPVAYPIADALGAPLEVLPVRKLGAPDQRELAIGAIALGGGFAVDESTLKRLGVSASDLERIIALAKTELERQQGQFRGGLPLPNLEGRTVILVDDGLATGLSALAAIRTVRTLGAGRVVLAVPVCAPQASGELRREVEDLVCLACPDDFYAVGLWYRDFEQTSDEAVLKLIALADQRAAGAQAQRHRGDEA